MTSRNRAMVRVYKNYQQFQTQIKSTQDAEWHAIVKRTKTAVVDFLTAALITGIDVNTVLIDIINHLYELDKTREPSQ